VPAWLSEKGRDAERIAPAEGKGEKKPEKDSEKDGRRPSSADPVKSVRSP
jgi:hypothetical protein